MMEIAKVFVVGIVGIGMATALFANGRNTAGVIKAGGSATQNLLYTAESGKK